MESIIRYPGKSAKIKSAPGLWATTLLTETEQVGLTLCKGGTSLAETTSAQISDIVDYTQQLDGNKEPLRRLSLCTVGDLTTVSKEGRKWNLDLAHR